MNSANHYPSCIKIPATTSPKYSSGVSQKDAQTLLAINYELISVANRVFGSSKWSHSISHQTLDFTESFLGKFLCGCCSYVKIQLDSGVFHEDMGYFIAEASTKPLAMQAARTGSLSNAFEKVLRCFGTLVENEVNLALKKYKNSKVITESKKEDSRKEDATVAELNVGKFEPCARSTPYLGAPNADKKETSGSSKLSKVTESPIKSNNNSHSILLSDIINKENMEIDVHNAASTVLTVTMKNNQEQLCKKNNQKDVIRRTDQVEVIKESDQEESRNTKNLGDHQMKVLSEEELLRRERRRKQMEKQAEYKRIMKERELQKIRGNEV